MIIATSPKYHTFVAPLLSSLGRYFLPDHDVAVHLWTDSTERFAVKHQFQIAAREWPFPTLLRYHYFLQQADVLAQCDYLFYLDADMLVVGKVSDEVLSSGITATWHPGFAFSDNYQLPYEQNPASKAFVQKQRYFAGGFQGGSTARFIDMATTIRDAIDDDLKRDYIACWHDESHYNRYLQSSPPQVILDPSYCYPQDALEGQNPAVRSHYLGRWGRDYEPRILALCKNPAAAAAAVPRKHPLKSLIRRAMSLRQR